MIKDFSFNVLHLQRALTKEFMKLLYNIQSIPSFVASNHFVLVRDGPGSRVYLGNTGCKVGIHPGVRVFVGFFCLVFLHQIISLFNNQIHFHLNRINHHYTDTVSCETLLVLKINHGILWNPEYLFYSGKHY